MHCVLNWCSRHSTPLLILLLWQATAASAFFRLYCDSITVERVDPIVAPGRDPSAHAHIIAGTEGFSGSMKYQDARGGKCTSAPTRHDMSAYWAPMLYFHHKTKGFKAVRSAGITVYYKYETDGTIEPFKPGFQMRAGKNDARTANPLKVVQWKCLDEQYTNVNTDTLPTRPCKNGLRAELNFPNCWDGRITTGGDESHMKYGTDYITYAGAQNGVQSKCPSSHPHKLPRLFYEVMFTNDDPELPWSEGMNSTQPYVIANGDPTGYGFHGDFLTGWDPAYLKDALTRCTGADGNNGASGEPSTCFDDARPTAQANTCKKAGDSPDLTSHEKVVDVWLKELPGGNEVR